ncbi:MAG: DUF2330 domain-containing protein [Kofleriaceae bacterium]
MRSSVFLVAAAAAIAVAAAPRPAAAFCGFYVSPKGGKLVNDATQVVLVRDGTKTVLSMQNDYKGPVEDFAMVVPVPVVLQEGDVKTLPRAVFERIDALGAPRLVEYWEQDPCPPPFRRDHMLPSRSMAKAGAPMAAEMAADKDDAVTIEAKFTVGEYQVLILSAKEASGLERWLKDNRYQIPDGAEPLLRPYVESGSKFFVAKVDPRKVTFEGGRAMLSPLRFHYDSDEFSLPVRLGMANSSGTQDLIVNILSASSRYEVSNYENVVIPTNFDVKDSVRTRFGEFYAALFDRTLATHPGAVVTEYAWLAQPFSKCDPCPPGAMIPTDADAMTLGGDVVGGALASGRYVLTRLHARYGRGQLNDDLRFREAGPIVGGREIWSGRKLEHGAAPSSINNFQARYAIRHPWTGAIKCKNPVRGVWGGPPNGQNQMVLASKLAFAPRGRLRLPTVIKRDLPEIKVRRYRPRPRPPAPATGATPAKTMSIGVFSALFLLGLGLAARHERKRAERGAAG